MVWTINLDTGACVIVIYLRGTVRGGHLEGTRGKAVEEEDPQEGQEKAAELSRWRTARRETERCRVN